jgi:hypothetical protein|tara:strand:+ start:216 stop:1976 length:1761 start_codon:yes stop_codon:yes gene_type:complete
MQSFKQHVKEDTGMRIIDLLPKKVKRMIYRHEHQDKYKAALLMVKALRRDPDVISRGLSKEKIQDIAADHFNLSHKEFAKVLDRKTRYERTMTEPYRLKDAEYFSSDNFINEAIKTEDLFKRDNKALFMQKAKAGKLIGKNGIITTKLSAADLKPLADLDDDPEVGSDEKKALTNMLKKLGGMGNIQKAENGFSPGDGSKPSGEDWESLIAVGVNLINGENVSNSPEWKRAEKYWPDNEKPAMKLGQAFVDAFKIKHLEQTGASSAPISKVWKGKNKTPKTDLLSAKGDKISLKKAGGSQLMSAGKEEAISTFEAAMSMYSISKEGKKTVGSMIDNIETNMNKMSTKGTIGALEKLRDSGNKLSKDQIDAVTEMEGLQDAAKELDKQLVKTFQDNEFKKYFCWEAATGETKFGKGSEAVSNLLVVFKDSGSIADSLVLDSPVKAGAIIAKANKFYVSFKTGGANSKPYLALRTKKPSKSDFQTESFADIVYDELGKSSYGSTFLNEARQEQLDEFALFNKLANKVKGVPKFVMGQAKKILNAIMKRLGEAFSYIKGLGKKMMEGLLAFFGLQINNVTVAGGGKFPL